jgi:hypothetical protein
VLDECYDAGEQSYRSSALRPRDAGRPMTKWSPSQNGTMPLVEFHTGTLAFCMVWNGVNLSWMQHAGSSAIAWQVLQHYVLFS